MNQLILLTDNPEEYYEQLVTYDLPNLEIIPCSHENLAAQYIQDCQIALAHPSMLATCLPYAKELKWAQSTWGVLKR